MMTQQLRRWTDKVDSDMLRRWSDKASNGLKMTGEAAKSGIDTVYTRAMNHPKSATAVVLGAGVAAALLWLATRNGTFSKRRKQTLERVRHAPKRARKTRAAATTS
jgi:hypothetical protein